jgi:hypothetical protein
LWRTVNRILIGITSIIPKHPSRIEALGMTTK